MKKLEEKTLIGITYSEYLKLFNLSEEELYDKKILDIGSGVNSFCAEANLNDMNVVAVDDIYFFNTDKIKEKAKKDLQKAKSFDNAKMALNLFVYDFEQNSQNYQPRKLPNLNFKAKLFDLALISNLNSNSEFNVKLILDALRVAKEVRVNIQNEKEILNDERLKNFKIENITNQVIIITN